MARGQESPLALDPETMRRLGYRTVDMLVDRLTGPPGPVVQALTPAQLRERLGTPPPEQAGDFDEILAALERDVLPFVARLNHPGYLAFIPGEGTWPGALGDLGSTSARRLIERRIERPALLIRICNPPSSAMVWRTACSAAAGSGEFLPRPRGFPPGMKKGPRSTRAP